MYKKITEQNSPQIALVGWSHLLPISRRFEAQGKKVLSFAAMGMNRPRTNPLTNPNNFNSLANMGIVLIDFDDETIPADKDYKTEIHARACDAENLIRRLTFQDSKSYKQIIDEQSTATKLNDITKQTCFQAYLRHDAQIVDAVFKTQDVEIRNEVESVLITHGIPFTIKQMQDEKSYLKVEQINFEEVAEKIQEVFVKPSTHITISESGAHQIKTAITASR